MNTTFNSFFLQSRSTGIKFDRRGFAFTSRDAPGCTKGILNRIGTFIAPLLKLTIRRKLSIAFVGFSALPVLVVGTFAWYMTAQTMRNSAIEELSHLTESVKIRLQDFVEVVHMDLRFLRMSFQALNISDPGALQTDPKATLWEEEALRLMYTRPQYARITYLVNSPGAQPFHLQRNPYDREHIAPQSCPYSWRYYQLLIQDLPPDGLGMTPVEHYDRYTGRTFAAFSVVLPDRSPEGDLRGILIADIFADEIFAIIESAPLDQGQYTAGLADSDGHYLYHSRKKQDWNKLLAEKALNSLQSEFSPEHTARTMADEQGVFITQSGDVVYHIPLEMGAPGFQRAYAFYISQPGSIIFAPLRKFGLIFLVLIGVFIGVALLLGRIATRQLVLPIQRLQEGADIIARGNFSHGLSIATGDEIEVLANRFNQMASFLQERDQQLQAYRTNLEQLVVQRTQQLRNEQNQVLQAEKLASLGEMAAVIAHEIRNSLTSANMLLQLVQESDKLESAEQESLEVVLGSVEHINKITTDLLAFARPAPPSMEPEDIAEVLEESVNLYRHHFEHHHIRTHIQTVTAAPEVSLDRRLMQEVVVNILLNASQAIGDDGEIVVRAGVEPSNEDLLARLRQVYRRNGGTKGAVSVDRVVRVEISDTGPGIPEQDLPKVFEPFFTTKAMGTGLGLSMARRVVEAHGGCIYAANRDGTGVSIHIILPVPESA